MWENLLRRTSGLPDEQVEEFSRERLDDPIARQTEWTCLPGGDESSFCTRTLRETAPQRCEFGPSGAMWAFAGLFLLGGGACVVVAAVQLVGSLAGTSGVAASLDELVVLVLSIVFFACGVILGKMAAKRAVFDKQRNLFWKQRDWPRRSPDGEPEPGAISLQRVHALQLLIARRQEDDSDYFHYQINLVLDDGQRELVVGHGSLRHALPQAQQLASFLNVPVWGPLRAERTD